MCRSLQCKLSLWPSLCVLCLSLISACSSQPEKQPERSRETSTNFICGGSHKDADWVCTEQAKIDSVKPPVKFSEYQAAKTAKAESVAASEQPGPKSPTAAPTQFPTITAPPLPVEQKRQKTVKTANLKVKPPITEIPAPKVVTAPKAAVVSPLSETLLQDQRFLLRQPSDTYTIQVAALKVESHARDYAANNDLKDALIARTISKGDIWYIVLSSTFSDYQSAVQEANYLQQANNLQTWIRPLSSLQRAIEEAQNAN